MPLDLKFCIELSAKGLARELDAPGPMTDKTFEFIKLLLGEEASENALSALFLVRRWTDLANKQLQLAKAEGDAKVSLDKEIEDDLLDLRARIKKIVQQHVIMPKKETRDKLRKAVKLSSPHSFKSKG